MANIRTRCSVLFCFLLRQAVKTPTNQGSLVGLQNKIVGMILLAVLLLPVLPAWGQGPMPGPQFAAEPVMPKPPEFCPPAGPAPVTRYPLVPAPDFVNAFDDPDCVQPHKICSFTVGTIGLRRIGLGNGVIGVFDPPLNPVGVPNPDTGNLPPEDALVAVSFNDIDTSFQWGVRASFGVQWERHIFEVSGYYIPEQTDTAEIVAPGQLDVAFAAFPTPLGFAGNNFLWLQADRVVLRLETQLANAEANYRYVWHPGIELIAGIRYFDVQETFSILTDDDGLVAQPPDPLRTATYQIQTTNRLIGPQLGFLCEHYLTENISFGFSTKGMLGADFLSVENRLIRGDGFERTPGSRDDVQLSGLTELELFVNIGFNEHIRLNAGYQALWILEVPVAHQQLNFNPVTPLGTVNDSGTIFYHGPRIELQLLF